MKVFKCDCGNVIRIKNKQPKVTCTKCNLVFRITWSKNTFVARQAVK